MNEAIENILNQLNVPFAFLYYNGHDDLYIVYGESDKDAAYAADDELAGYITFYDIDIYSKTNYLPVMEQIKTVFKNAGWMWQPSRDSEDIYETNTGYYHKTLCFALPIQIED